MSLKERQEAMRRRLELERVDEEKRLDISEHFVSGQSAGMKMPDTQSKSRPTKGTTDVERDPPIARLLDLKAAGRYLGVSYWTVRDLVFGGLIPSVKIPCPRTNDGRTIRRLLVDRRDLDAFIEKNKEFEQ